MNYFIADLDSSEQGITYRRDLNVFIKERLLLRIKLLEKQSFEQSNNTYVLNITYSTFGQNITQKYALYSLQYGKKCKLTPLLSPNYTTLFLTDSVEQYHQNSPE